MTRPSPTMRAVMRSLEPLYPSVTYDQLCSQTKLAKIVEPRHLAMTVLVRLGWSTTKAAGALGRIDHTSVIYGRRRAEQRHPPQLIDALVEDVRRKLVQ